MDEEDKQKFKVIQGAFTKETKEPDLSATVKELLENPYDVQHMGLIYWINNCHSILGPEITISWMLGYVAKMMTEYNGNIEAATSLLHDAYEAYKKEKS